MKHKWTPQDKTQLGLLVIILAVGAFLYASGDHTKPKHIVRGPEDLLPRIDVSLETMQGAAQFRPTEPTVKRSYNRGAAVADVFVPVDVTRSALIAATKNALIRIYQGQDPTQVQWIEVHVYLEGEIPGPDNMAALGMLNPDRRGYLKKTIRHGWRLEIRLLDDEQRRAAGLGQKAMQRLVAEVERVAKWRRDFAVAHGVEPTGDQTLAAAEEMHFSKKELEKILQLHEKLYSDRQVLEWNLR
jgi:GNAT superfamily N-acetyltransferase